MPCCTVVLLHMGPSWTSFPVPSIPRESSVLHVPSAAVCPCLPWALAEEEALPRGVAVWLPSSCCRRSSIVLPGFSFLFTSLSLSRGDPSAPGPTVSSHRELPTNWWQSCCLVICGLPIAAGCGHLCGHHGHTQLMGSSTGSCSCGHLHRHHSLPQQCRLSWGQTGSHVLPGCCIQRHIPPAHPIPASCPWALLCPAVVAPGSGGQLFPCPVLSHSSWCR